MGQEIADSKFAEEAFTEFARRVASETALLGEWLRAGALHVSGRKLGFELEGCLVNADGMPAPENQAFLEAADDPLIVSELARFNFELNSPPLSPSDSLLSRMHDELARHWRYCEATADSLGLNAMMVGILPTLRKSDLSLRHISPLERYRALNEQVFRLRDGAPIELDIPGVDPLRHRHDDLMLESATTSLQIHLQVDQRDAVRAFNAAKMLSAPMVAACANSPFLFGHRLWQETRIPLFEQAVAVGGSDYCKRVTFGIRYARDSILECFDANRDRYPVILPELMDTPLELLAHLRLHNGTVWRWNRPLIGFSDDGAPHIRIEHRVVPAGPTPRDSVANIAFFSGLMHEFLAADNTLEQRLPFDTARNNFYQAARHGLAADIVWLDGRQGTIRELITERLLPMARTGLRDMGVAAGEADDWLDIIGQRVKTERTGSHWMMAWVDRHGDDFPALVRTYIEHQQTDNPVHRWTL